MGSASKLVLLLLMLLMERSLLQQVNKVSSSAALHILSPALTVQSNPSSSGQPAHVFSRCTTACCGVTPQVRSLKGPEPASSQARTKTQATYFWPNAQRLLAEAGDPELTTRVKSVMTEAHF